MINDAGKHGVKEGTGAVRLPEGYCGSGCVKRGIAMKSLAEQIADIDAVEICGRVAAVGG
jgi:hypothetical protein